MEAAQRRIRDSALIKNYRRILLIELLCCLVVIVLALHNPVFRGVALTFLLRPVVDAVRVRHARRRQAANRY